MRFKFDKRWSWCASVGLFAIAMLSGQLSKGSTPQIGGGSCSTGMLKGTYNYVLAGTVAQSGVGVPYAELGELTADGSGNVSGKSLTSLNGQQGTYSLAGTYSVQSTCTGTITYTVNSANTAHLTFQVINAGQSMVVAISDSGEVVVGRAYKQTSRSSSIQCSNSSLSGNYGYLLTGFSPGGYVYSDAGQASADGNGNLSVVSLANSGGSVTNVQATGSYSISSDCTGTASVSDQYGTANYALAIANDGEAILFIETDGGYTVGGTGQPQFTSPQMAVVNGASFQSEMVAPGSLFSVFGTGLSSSNASAQGVPLPTMLSRTQVLVNGTAAPLIYVSNGQINAQMPVDVPIGQSITLSVTNGGASSNVVLLNLPSAAPGLFVYNGTQAIVQNPNGSLNSVTAPAHVGDVLVAYLTGGGAVNSSAWITGAASPAGPASVAASYTLTVGGQRAQVQYLGLTPGFVGLYQANFTVPSLSAGEYPVVVTMAGNASNAATVAIGS